MYTNMAKLGRCDFALVVVCGLTKFTKVLPCTKHITNDEIVKIFFGEHFRVYGGFVSHTSALVFKVQSSAFTFFGRCQTVNFRTEPLRLQSYQ